VSAGRSGACYGDDAPELHAVCSGRYTRQLPTSSPETHTCGCPCHRTGTSLNLAAAKSGASAAGRRGGQSRGVA
jgi:hypothetical protein